MKMLEFLPLFNEMLIKNWATVFLCFLSFNLSFSQGYEFVNLNSKNYDELQALFDALPNDSIDKREVIAKIYLSKAKRNLDTISIGRGYYLLSALNKSLINSKQYADSIIVITRNVKHESFPALGYFLKGHWCYQLSEYQESLHNYLIGDSIAKKRGNITQYVGNRSMIAQLKNRAGDYRGALEIYLNEIDSLSLLKKSNPLNYLDYLNRLYNTSLTYMHLKNLDSARLYSNKGLEESLKIQDSLSYFDFVYNLGIIEYLSGNEETAKVNINKALPYLDNYSQAMAYYYKGEIARHDLHERNALSFFKISDSIAENLNYTFPELRNVYEYTIDHYEEKKDLSNQLVYVNKLLKLDSTLTHSKDLQLEITKKYDRLILLNKKESIIESLESKNKLRNVIILLLIVVTIGLVYSLYYYRKRQKVYLQKFNALVNENNQTARENKLESPQSSDLIPIDIYNKIVLGLKSFENDYEFLKPTTLAELAKKLDTNTSYLSKFINFNTENNFSQYLNKLRMKYVIARLKTDSKLRAFTIKAIAEEIGYGTAQSFSKAFYQETGIYPSYFIKKLNND